MKEPSCPSTLCLRYYSQLNTAYIEQNINLEKRWWTLISLAYRLGFGETFFAIEICQLQKSRASVIQLSLNLF